MNDNDDSIYSYSLLYWHMNFSYLPYGILNVLRTRTFSDGMYIVEKYNFIVSHSVVTV